MKAKRTIRETARPLRIPVLSFFTGGGFLDIGFEQAGFEVAWTNEIDGVFAALSRLENTVFAQWRNYIKRTEYKVYYKVFQRNLSKTIDQWWNAIKGYISYLEGQKRKLEAILPTQPTEAQAEPGKKIEPEIAKIAEKWWRGTEAIKKDLELPFKELDSMVGVFGTASDELKDYLWKLHDSNKKVLELCNDVISVGRNKDFFESSFDYMWRTVNFRGLDKAIDEFKEIVRIFDNKIKEEGVKFIVKGKKKQVLDITYQQQFAKFYEGFTTVSELYKKAIGTINVHDLKSLLHTTTEIIEKRQK